jgi:hypothetical protein
MGIPGTVVKFRDDFVNEFSLILTKPGLTNNTFGDYCRLWTNKPKFAYSDWDLEFWLNTPKIDANMIRRIDKFIRSRIYLSYKGRLLTFSTEDKFVSKFNTKEWSALAVNFLQYMAFMSNEDIAPFIDIHLHNTDPYIIDQLFRGVSDYELLSWLEISVWRKKN